MLFNTTMAAVGISGLSVAATAALGSLYTQQSVRDPWYNCIRTGYTPPSWVFPVVWTTLYVVLAVAFTLSILNDSAFPTILHIANLALNVAWCFFFFGRKEVGTALGVIVGNVGVAIAIALATRDYRVTYIMIPYICWLLFATALNIGTFQKVADCQ